MNGQSLDFVYVDEASEVTMEEWILHKPRRRFMSFMSMFIRKSEVSELQSEYEKTLKALRATKEELEDLKLKKRLEAEEIKHMVRINEEKNKQELESEKVRLIKEYQESISQFKEQQRVQLVESLKDFHGKIEKRFGDELSNLKEVYGLLMQRLPNVNLSLTKKL